RGTLWQLQSRRSSANSHAGADLAGGLHAACLSIDLLNSLHPVDKKTSAILQTSMSGYAWLLPGPWTPRVRGTNHKPADLAIGTTAAAALRRRTGSRT